MATLAKHQDEELQRNARRQGVNLTLADARTLRRAQLTLHSWDELRCGWSTPGEYGDSRVLVRDEDGDDKPYIEIHPNKGFNIGWKAVPDRERGALRRIQAVCETYGASYYHQSDPRGAALYISADKLTDSNYAQAICCAV
jgi:hypothetical protein